MPRTLSFPPVDPATFLASTDMFAGLDPDVLQKAASSLEWLSARRGETLVREGAAGDALYLVASGRLHTVRENADGGCERLREIGRGGNLGELALLSDAPCPATVVVARDSLLARFSRAQFHRLLARHPDAALPLTRALADRLRSSHPGSRHDTPASTIALVPLSLTVPLAQLAEQLGAALAAMGDTVHIDLRCVGNGMPAIMGRSDDVEGADSALSGWLDELELAHRFVVYHGSLAAPAWTQRCIRQADTVVFVAYATDDVEAAAARAAMTLGDTTGPAREELVLLHDGDRSPSGTAAWLARRRFAAHHHARLDHDADMQRLARRLTGNAIGVVLSGGGARGLAHIGVLRALEDAGIPIDRIGGTGMGALIAAQYACGVTPAEMLELNRLWQRHHPLRDLTLPVIALVSGTSTVAMLDAMFGARRIEDLWLEYFCVSTNLTRSTTAVHRDGPLAQWVRASIAIPGVAPPLRLPDGDLLADGGVLNNLPTDVMRRLGAGRTIAVDVAAASPLPSEDDVDQPSIRLRLRLLAGGALPFGTPPRWPAIFGILYRTTLVGSRPLSERLKHEIDLYIGVPVDRFGLFEWSALSCIAEAGYRAGRARIEAWIASGQPRAAAPRIVAPRRRAAERPAGASAAGAWGPWRATP